MLVKKYEAKSMKDALELVKKELGPDAIILSVKDNKKKFGIAGENSVEVTAAISETKLHEKKFAEKKFKSDNVDQFRNQTARVQKQFIEKSLQSFRTSIQEKPAVKTGAIYLEEGDDYIPQRRAVNTQNTQKAPAQTTTRKIQIPSLEEVSKVVGHSVDNVEREVEERHNKERVRMAAQAARNAVEFLDEQPVNQQQVASNGAFSASGAMEMVPAAEVEKLKTEILKLQQVITDFSRVPQNFITSHPGSNYGVSYEFSHEFERLTTAGLTSENAAEMLLQAQKEIPLMQAKKPAVVTAWVAKHILNDMHVVANPTGAKVHVFVGGPGSGKTSTLVKMASHAVIAEKKRVAIVTTDSRKVGAVDQLRIFAKILNVPFAVVSEKSQWSEIWAQLISADMILIDTHGVAMKDIAEIDELRSIQPPKEFTKAVHYIQSATVKDADAIEMGARFRVANYTDVIFTSLDESTQHGIIYNFQKKFQVPLHSFGTGSRIPEDYELATKERVLDLIFKLSKMGNGERVL